MRFTGWVFVGLAAMLATNVHAEGRLEIELRYPAGLSDRRSDGGTGAIEVVLRNSGDRPVGVSPRELPFVNREGRLTHDFFKVDDGGGRVGYRGIYVEYSTGDPESYVELTPGQAKVYPVDLVKSYAVEAGGIYDVSVAQPVNYLSGSIGRRSVGDGNASSSLLRRTPAGNTLRVWIDPRIRAQGVRAAGSASATPCTASQVSDFNAAKASATSKALEAAEHLGGLYGETGFVPSARYTSGSAFMAARTTMPTTTLSMAWCS